MYVNPNFKTKKALKEAVANGETVTVFQPGPFAGGPTRGQGVLASVEGPHYPEAHRWYALVTLNADGKVVAVK